VCISAIAGEREGLPSLIRALRQIQPGLTLPTTATHHPLLLLLPTPAPSSVELPGQREHPLLLLLLLLPQCLLPLLLAGLPEPPFSQAQPIRAAARYWPLHPGAVLALPLAASQSALATVLPPGRPSLHSRAGPAPTKITLYPPRAPRPPTSSPPPPPLPSILRGDLARSNERSRAICARRRAFVPNVGRPPLAPTAKGLPPHPSD
jgi:hypothetical protein